MEENNIYWIFCGFENEAAFILEEPFIEMQFFNYQKAKDFSANFSAIIKPIYTEYNSTLARKDKRKKLKTF